MTENFQIKYLISQQKSKGQEQVASTSFTLDAELTTKKFTGDLELTIKKVNGANVQANTLALGLSGQFTAQLGSVTLQTAYSFTQVRGNNAVTTAFGFNGSLAFKNGEFVWAFERNAQQTTISVEGNIKVGAARIDERLNIHMDGNKVVGVQVLFGVAF